MKQQNTTIGLFFLLASLAVIACMRAPAAQYGILRGTVALPNGMPYVNAPVAVKAGPDTFEMKCDATGAFSGITPAGPITITVGELTSKAAVKPGEVTVVKLSTRLKGVLLKVSYPDGTRADAWVGFAYRAPRGGETGLYATRMGAGYYWLAGLPETATALSVIVSRYAGNQPISTRKLWSFDTPAASRELTMEINPLLPVRLLMVDTEGIPLLDVPVWGSLRCPKTSPVGYWEEDGEPRPGSLDQFNLADLHTDYDGWVTLGAFPPQTYELILGAGNGIGTRVTFTLSADGELTIAQYRQTAVMREKVTHLLHTDRGSIAAKTKVFASYCWQGRTVLRESRSDDAGRVTWENLPPVRVIIWGEKAAVGVIPAAGTQFHEQLEAPVPEPGQHFLLVADNAGDVQAPITWNIERPHVGRLTGTTEIFRTGLPWAVISHPLAGGQPFTMLVELKTKPVLNAFIKDVYLPYLDVEVEALFRVALERDIMAEEEPDETVPDDVDLPVNP